MEAKRYQAAQYIERAYYKNWSPNVKTVYIAMAVVALFIAPAYGSVARAAMAILPARSILSFAFDDLAPIAAVLVAVGALPMLLRLLRLMKTKNKMLAVDGHGAIDTPHTLPTVAEVEDDANDSDDSDTRCQCVTQREKRCGKIGQNRVNEHRVCSTHHRMAMEGKTLRFM